jgi:hypothetical protein
MSRKLILTLAAAASVAAASVTLGSSAVYARSMGGGHFSPGGAHFSAGGPHLVSHNPGLRRPIRVVIPRPGRPGGRLPPIIIGHHPFPPHHHHHWVFRGGHWIVLGDEVVAAPVVERAVMPGPCSCLTKTYTPEGLVVFADVCTRESASAPALEDTADASQAPTTDVPAKATPISQVPTKPNYAGRTYEQYLAANPQLQPQAAVPAPQQN